MSGGTVAVAPALVVAPAVAAAAVVVVGAAVAAALVIKGVQAGTAATGRALENLGEEMERAARQQDDRAIRARLWDLSASAAVQANQELRLLSARAQKANVRVPLPPPYDLDGQSLERVRDWAAQTRRALANARAAIEDAEAERERRVLLRSLPTPPSGSPTAAELLARYQEALTRRRPAPRPEPLPARVDPSQVHAQVGAILARLDVDATAAERETAIVAGARAAKQTDAGMSRTFLDKLVDTVDKDINPRVVRRREAAALLVALEHPVVVEAVAEAEPVPPCFDAVARLRAAVLGDADVTDADLRKGRDAVAWAQQEVERRRLLEVVAEAFGGLGYAVTTGLQINHSAGLSVARPGWDGAHTADVWFDERGQLQSRLVELAAGAPSERSRCEDLNASTRSVGEALARRGFDATVHLPDELIKPVRRHGDAAPVRTSSTVDSALKQRTKNHGEED